MWRVYLFGPTGNPGKQPLFALYPSRVYKAVTPTKIFLYNRARNKDGGSLKIRCEKRPHDKKQRDPVKNMALRYTLVLFTLEYVSCDFRRSFRVISR